MPDHDVTAAVDELAALADADTPPGCGWTEQTHGYPMEWAMDHCAARRGYRPAHDVGEPNPTVGRVNLCVGCSIEPANLLAALSLKVAADA